MFKKLISSNLDKLFLKNIVILLIIPFILLYLIKYFKYRNYNYQTYESFKNIEKFQLPHNIDIKFLNQKESQDLYNNLNLIKYFQSNEISAKSNHAIDRNTNHVNSQNQNQLLTYYNNNVSNFSKTEQNAIFKIIFRVSEKVKKMISYRSLTWKFAKLSYNTDWNYPYTIDDVIVLPEKFVKNITYFYKTNNPSVLDSAINTFIHEWLHVIQRQHQSKFDKYYKEKWNYIYCPNLRDNMLKNEWIKTYWITNPDGMNGEWAINTSKGLLTPMVLLDTDFYTHRKVLIKVSSTQDSIVLNNNTPIYYTFNEVPDFNEKVFNITQSYHPNEVFANLVAKQIMEQESSPEIKFLNEFL